jgi:hypothetical protein
MANCLESTSARLQASIFVCRRPGWRFGLRGLCCTTPKSQAIAPLVQRVLPVVMLMAHSSRLQTEGF